MRMRRAVAAVLVIVASLLAPVAVGSVWAARTLTNSDEFVETVAPLADSPQVQDAVGAAATTAILERLDTADRLREVFPNAPRLTDAVAVSLDSAISNAIDSYVHSERFGEAWLRITEAMQRSFVALLNHESQGVVTLQEGQLILDTRVALELIQAELVERGIPFVASIDLTNAGQQIVLASTPNLQIVADALDIFLPIADWLWLVVVAMFVAAILLWPRRSRGLAWAGLGLAVASVLTWTGLDLGQAHLVNAAETPERGILLAEVFEVVLRFLINALLVCVAVGVAMLVAGLLGGASASGVRVRLAVTRVAHRVGSPLAPGTVGRVTARTPLLVPVLRGLVLVGAALWLVSAHRLTPSLIMWAAFWTVVGLLVVEVIEGAGRGHDRASAGALAADAT